MHEAFDGAYGRSRPMAIGAQDAIYSPKIASDPPEYNPDRILGEKMRPPDLAEYRAQI
jgi:hypothetical protein